MRVLYPGPIGFCGGRRIGEPGEIPCEQSKNQQQTQPTYGTGPESNPDHIGPRSTAPSLLPKVVTLVSEKPEL